MIKRILVLSGLTLFTLSACVADTETKAEPKNYDMEFADLQMSISSEGWGTPDPDFVYNIKTECIYNTGFDGDFESLVPIAEQTWDDIRGKCIGPYQKLIK